MGEVELVAPYRLETAHEKTKYGQTWKALFWGKGFLMKKVDIIMSARQMNVNYIYIIYLC